MGFIVAISYIHTYQFYYSLTLASPLFSFKSLIYAQIIPVFLVYCFLIALSRFKYERKHVIFVILSLAYFN